MSKYYLRAAAVAVALSVAAPSQAAVITVLPGGTAQPMPPVNLFTAGPQTFGNITYSSTSGSSVYGYTGGYGYSGNGFRSSGPPMAGLNEAVGMMTFAFATPQSGVLAFINWAQPGASGGQPITGEIFDSNGNLLESLVFSTTGDGNTVAPGNWGFSRSQGDIASLRLSNGFITADSFQTLASAAGVPEPATWAMLILGFGMVGGTMRSARRPKVSVAYA